MLPLSLELKALGVENLKAMRMATGMGKPFYGRICCLKPEVFTTGLITVCSMSAMAGLVLLANRIDGGPLSQVNPFVLAAPFTPGLLGLVLLLGQLALSMGWRSWCGWAYQRSVNDFMRRVAAVPELRLTTAEFERFEYFPVNSRVHCAQVVGLYNLLITTHPNGDSTRGLMTSQPWSLSHARSDDAIHVTSVSLNPTARSQLSFSIANARIMSEWFGAALVSAVIIGWLASCPLMLAWRVRPIIAFIPPMIAASLGVARGLWLFWKAHNTNWEHPDWILHCAFTLAAAALVALFAMVALMLEDVVTPTATADWATALVPAWVFLLCMTVLATFSTIHLTRERFERHRKAAVWNVAFAFVVVCIFVAIVAFNVSLVAICYIASREWSVMSYTGLANIIVAVPYIVVLGLYALILILDKTPNL